MVAGAETQQLIPCCTVDEARTLLQQRFPWLRLEQQARWFRARILHIAHHIQQVAAPTTDAATLAQLLLCPVTTLPAARLLRPHLPAAVRALVAQDPALLSTASIHATTIALTRMLHIAPHLLDAALPWLTTQPPPWDGVLAVANTSSSSDLGAMQPADVLLAALHALQTMPRLLRVWSAASLPALLSCSNDGVLRWGALQCLAAHAGMSDAATR